MGTEDLATPFHKRLEHRSDEFMYRDAATFPNFAVRQCNPAAGDIDPLGLQNEQFDRPHACVQ
jgi:hypothetical protein